MAAPFRSRLVREYLAATAMVQLPPKISHLRKDFIVWQVDYREYRLEKPVQYIMIIFVGNLRKRTLIWRLLFTTLKGLSIEIHRKYVYRSEPLSLLCLQAFRAVER